MKVQAVAGQARRFLLTFDADDLSADARSRRVRVPLLNGQPCQNVSLYIGCTATDAPTGRFVAKWCSSVTDDGHEIGTEDDGVTIESMSVAGGPGQFQRMGIPLDGSEFFAVDWEWESGGGGAVVTNHKNEPESQAIVSFY